MQLFGIHCALSLYHAIGPCLQNYYSTKQIIDAHNISVYMCLYVYISINVYTLMS